MSEIRPTLIFPEVTKDSFEDPLVHDHLRFPGRVVLLNTPPEFYDNVFYRSSNFHGRSMEDVAGAVIKKQPLADENGDLYTCFTIKGADMSNPVLTSSELEPSYVRVNGMMDSILFKRCREVSQLLRQEGALTEWPLVLARPKQFIYGGSQIGLQALRSALYNQHRIISTDLKDKLPPGYSFSIGQLGRIGQGLLEINFGVMYRATLVSERLVEISTFKEAGTLDKATAKAIEALQQRKPEHFYVWDEIAKLDPANPDDHKTYLSDHLPRLIGQNLAIFHNAGTFHKYPHMGNWTLAGELIDLDSVRSEVLYKDDGETISFSDTLMEIFTVLDEASTLLSEASGDDQQTIATKIGNSYYADRILGDNIGETEKLIVEACICEWPRNSSDYGEALVARMTDPEVKTLSTPIILSLVLGDDEKRMDTMHIHNLVKASFNDLVTERLQQRFEKAHISQEVSDICLNRVRSYELARVTIALQRIVSSFKKEAA